MTAFEMIVLGLATWRVSSLLVQEDGPFMMFYKLRERVGLKHDDSGNIYLIPKGFLPGILSCVWCCSVWAAGAWMLAWYLVPKATVIAAQFLAISALAIFVDRWKK